MKKEKYYVKGMHCASCEVLIEKQLLEMDGINQVEADQKKGFVEIGYESKKPSLSSLNKMFKEKGYKFDSKDEGTKTKVDYLNIFLIVAILLMVLYFVERTGLVSWVVIDSNSSLGVIWLFGLVAGFSSCAALVGGLLLSMSKQWSDLYSSTSSVGEKITPHVLFNIGRLLSYALLGGVLGLIGGSFGFNLTISAFVVMFVSLIMIFLALNMMGVKGFESFSLSAPKFLTRYVSDEKNFSGRNMPFLLGVGTFFLPCGFTITAQGIALLSGSFWTGLLIMLFFALGTLPMLIFISVSSVKMMERPHVAGTFLKIAGVVVLFFGIFNINSQLNVLGLPSLSNLSVASSADSDLPIVENGVQVIEMEAGASGYSPNYFKLRAGVPVVWNVNAGVVSGCTNAIISPGLIEGSVALKNNEVTTIEFTPESPGNYKFSCWMGMISGVFEVVDETGVSGENNVAEILYDNSVSVSGSCEATGGEESCGGSCGGGCGSESCEFAG